RRYRADEPRRLRSHPSRRPHPDRHSRRAERARRCARRAWQADDRVRDQRPPAELAERRRESRCRARVLVPGPGRRRRRGRGAARPHQSRRQAAGHGGAQRRPDPAVPRPQAELAPRIPVRGLRPAVRVRPRALLHHVRDRRAAGLRLHRPPRPAGRGHRQRHQHRPARGGRGGAALYRLAASLGHAADHLAQGLRARHARTRRAQDGELHARRPPPRHLEPRHARSGRARAGGGLGRQQLGRAQAGGVHHRMNATAAPAAILKAGGRYRWAICALLFLVITINYVDRQVLGVLKPIIEEDMGWSEVDYGNIVTAFQASYGIGLLVVGRWLDRVGTRKGMAIAIALWSLAAMLHAAARTVLQFILVRIALGVAESAAYPGAVKSVAEWFPRRERALGVGILNAGANVGVLMTPIVGIMVAAAYGWEMAFLVTGLLGFIVFGLWIWLFRRPDD